MAKNVQKGVATRVGGGISAESEKLTPGVVKPRSFQAFDERESESDSEFFGPCSEEECRPKHHEKKWIRLAEDEIRFLRTKLEISKRELKTEKMNRHCCEQDLAKCQTELEACKLKCAMVSARLRFVVTLSLFNRCADQRGGIKAGSQW